MPPAEGTIEKWSLWWGASFFSSQVPFHRHHCRDHLFPIKINIFLILYELFTFHYAPLHVSNSFSFARFYYIFSFSSFTTFTDSLVPLALLGFQKFDRGWTYIPMSQDYLVHFCCDIISAKLFHSWGDIFVAGCINLVLVCSSSGEDSRFEGREKLAIVRLRKAKMYKQNFQPQRIW